MSSKVLVFAVLAGLTMSACQKPGEDSRATKRIEDVKIVLILAAEFEDQDGKTVRAEGYPYNLISSRSTAIHNMIVDRHVTAFLYSTVFFGKSCDKLKAGPYKPVAVQETSSQDKVAKISLNVEGGSPLYSNQYNVGFERTVSLKAENWVSLSGLTIAPSELAENYFVCLYVPRRAESLGDNIRIDASMPKVDHRLFTP